MPFDANHSGTDEFQFNTTSELFQLPTATTGQIALTQALLSRDIEVSELTDAQTETFSDFAELLDTASAADINTSDHVINLLGEDLDITFVEDFRTTDGQKLDGAATEHGRIFLDADLTGASLKATLVEEIAEAAFNEAFDSTSQGDFGAEVAARLSGKTDPAVLAAFSSETQDDTVQTEFGTAEAATSSPVSDQFTFPFSQDIIGVNNLDGTYDHKLTTYGSGDLPPFERLDEPTLVTPGARQMNLSNIQGKYDLNGDGVLDQYAMRAAYADVERPISVLGVTPTKLLPTSQSNSVLIGQGEASTTWVLRTEQRHETSAEFNWNSSVATTLEASGEFLGIGASASVTASVEAGGSVKSTNAFTVANEVRDTYTIPAGAYEPGTLVNYGFHMIVGDVDVVQHTLYILEITNAASGTEDFITFQGYNRDTIQDHYAGLVVTDYDVNNPPLGEDIIGLA
ncbi:hypothetical protein KUV51_07430 [Tateyamaria omphalii]|uniref:hypothetical protein n=1 Tax=Tateyamaria omphalii TaxID=299262 RepID=UPI001C99BA91|nr:hypothetical protein [Tateyamaria omphalii]MBY5932826.1 hypothetical protein [Tateyamaria omphalii]